MRNSSEAMISEILLSVSRVEKNTKEDRSLVKMLVFHVRVNYSLIFRVDFSV